MNSRVRLVVTLVVAVLAGSLVPAVASSPAAAQEQTSWYVNDNPTLHGPSQSWWWGDRGEGYGSNNYRFTFGIGGESSPDNWARWSMGRRVGRQEIQAYIPHTKATATVTYRIDIGGREYTRRLNQLNAYGWTSLGNYDADGASVTITLRDNDTARHYDRVGYVANRMGVDAIRMRCVSRCSSSPPPPPPPAPQPQPPPPPPPAPQPPPPPAPQQQRQGSSSGCGVASLGSVSGSVSRSGEWADSCLSGNRSGSYARLFEFSLSGAREVTIDLESNEVEAFLFLIDGSRQIASDDDGGDSTNSRITRTLSAGTYRVEATTYSSGEAGSFELTVTAARTGASSPPAPPSSRSSSGGCELGVLRGEAGVVAGVPADEWIAGCVSQLRGDGSHLARRYRLDLRDAGEMTIELSSETDTYLYLLNDQGEVIEQNDDGGSGTDSRIVREMSAGTYIVEATTYRAGTAGSFTLAVSIEDSSSPPPQPSASQRESGSSSSGCDVASLNLNGGSVSHDGEWSDNCLSGTRSGRYARLFEFSLSGEREVTIDLESEVDTYLYLLDSQRRVIADDDDGGSGTNSRITRTLAAGTYRVEATTYSEGEAGRFSLDISAGAEARSSSPAPVLAVGDDARPSGHCSSSSCRWFRISNLRPGSRVECWREGLEGAFVTFTARSDTSTRNCYFSYVGARVYVVADGVRSNTITWPSASVQPPPPPSSQRSGSSSGCGVVSLGTIGGGSTSESGRWSDDCTSGNRSGHFARLFEFSLSAEREVTIDLESDEADTFLFLISDANTQIESDDDGGSGTNSRITRTLAAGTYRLEATTYGSGETGDFTIRVRTSIFNTEIEQILSRIGQSAVVTFAEAASGAKDVGGLESRLQGTNTGDETIASLTRQASLSASRASSELANIEAEKRELIQVLASVLGVRNDENAVRNPTLVRSPNLLIYSEQVLSSLDHMAESAEANAVWAEWSRIAAGSLCSSWARGRAQDIIDDVNLVFAVLRLTALLPAAKRIIVNGLDGLAEVALDQIEDVARQWVLDKILPEPIDMVIDAVVFLEPPDPPASLRDSGILPICYYENGIQVWLPRCSDRGFWQTVWQNVVAGSNCRDD